MTTNDNHRQIVLTAVAGALELEPDEVEPNASLIDDLGAESIDFLDIQFRIERAAGHRFGEGQLFRGRVDLADPEWVVDGQVTDLGAERLRGAQPDYPWDRLPTPLPVRDLPRLLTVASIADRLAELQSAAGADPG